MTNFKALALATLTAISFVSAPVLRAHAHELDDHSAVVYLLGEPLSNGEQARYLCSANHEEGDRFVEVICSD